MKFFINNFNCILKKEIARIILPVFCFFGIPALGQNEPWSANIQHGTTTELKRENHHNLFFLDAQNGWASGRNGVLKQTTDGGATWSDIVIPESDWLGKIFFLNTKVGWVSDLEGQVLFHTTDGGASWTKTPLDGISEYHGYVDKIMFLSPNKGFMLIKSAFHGLIFETENGGKTWSNKLGEDNYFTSFCFLDNNIGWALHRLGALKTTDGGKKWVAVKNTTIRKDENHPFWKEGIYTDIAFFDKQNGVITAALPNEFGYLLLTSDGGTTWKKKKGPAKLLNTSYSFPEELIDRPESFTTSLKIQYVDRNTIYFISDQKAYYSTDQCNNYSEINTEMYPNYGWNSIYFLSNQKAFITAGIGLFLSENNGLSWKPLNDLPPQGLNDVFFIHPNLGWAVGNGGTILKSINGGENWEKQTINTQNNLLSIFFITPTTGWITSNKGDVFYTENGGDEWKATTLKKAINSNNSELAYLKEYYPDLTYFPIFEESVKMIDLKFGWLFGASAEKIDDPTPIYYTDDGGISWNEINTNEDFDFIDIYFQNKVTAYAITSNALYKTTDGCQTWKEVDLNHQNKNFSGITRVSGSELILLTMNHALFYNTSTGEVRTTKLPGRGSSRNNTTFLTQQIGWYVTPPHTTKNAFETLDGGESWHAMLPEGTIPFNILGHCVLNENNIWLVGEFGLIVKLTNNRVAKQEEKMNEVKDKIENIRGFFNRN